MAIIKQCLCIELGSCSLLAGIYTTALSVIFIGIGLDELVLVNRKAAGQDIVTLTVVYGILVALSALYGVSSATLVIAVSRKRRMYFIPWLILTPIWTTMSVVVLMVLPIELAHAVELGDFPVRLAGTLVILLLNTTAMVCASLLLHIFLTTPSKELKSQGVAETLRSGFRDAGDRIRQSFRVKRTPTVTYTTNERTAADSVQVTIPDMGSAIVLQATNLELVRSEKSRVKARSAAAHSKREEVEVYNSAPVEVSIKMTASLTGSQQLSCANDMSGLDNPGFHVEDD